jgi:hypothetical protein
MERRKRQVVNSGAEGVTTMGKPQRVITKDPSQMGQMAREAMMTSL